MRLGTLISVKQLSEALTKFPRHLRILDTSWHVRTAERDPYAEYIKGHIPEALFFDLEECRDKNTNYDHMLPSPREFENYVGQLGIRNDSHVILYENNASGFYSAPRAWWVFRVFGHYSVSLLDGGFPRWLAEGGRSTQDTYTVGKQVFKANYDSTLVTVLDDILENKKTEKFQLVDARPTGRFDGTENEPSGMPGGHISGSINMNFKKFMTNEEGRPFQTMRSIPELRQIIRKHEIDLDKPIIATCGMAMTACSFALAAFMCGKEDIPVYDGSWMEYYDKKTQYFDRKKKNEEQNI